MKRFRIAAPQRWYLSIWIAATVAVGLSVGWSYVLTLGVLTPGWRSFYIASASMLPGLMPNDRVLIDVRRPGRMPTYGDVIVFHGPDPLGRPGHPAVHYMERVVGLPGDYVELRAGILYLNDRAVQRQSIGTFVESDWPHRAYKRYRETLPNGRSFDILLWKKDAAWEYTLPVRVPAGHAFVLGDNRDDSFDSRERSIGFVPQANIDGRAYTIYWSGDLSRLFKHVE